MNTENIRNIPCQQYLSSRGIEPKSTHGRTWKYLCPWRGEKEASLHIYPNNNKWYDFGEHVGGSVIDLCMKVEGVDFKDACVILSGKEKYTLEPPKKIERQQESPIKILWSGRIESAWLIRYIEDRCIPIDVARRFCSQARVEIKTQDGASRKTMIMFRNDKGGAELRNGDKYGKLSTSPKYYTSINKGKDVAVVTEGMFSFLSQVVKCGYSRDVTSIILNSVGNVDYVDWSVYRLVEYYGDNDNPGQKCLDKISLKTTVIDKRYLYKQHNDPNDWLRYKDTTSVFDRINKLDLRF